MHPLQPFFDLRVRAHAIPREHHDAIMAAFGRLLVAHTIVELGSGDGHGTATFIDVVRKNGGGRVVSVDIGAETVSRRKHENAPEVEFVVSDSVSYAASWLGGVDIVYCDSDHSRAHVLAELRAWSSHRPRIIFVDDTLDPNAMHGSPLEAVVDFCQENPSWSWWNVAVHTGLAIVVPSLL